MDPNNLRAFFRKHVASVVEACRNEYSYSWDDHKKQIDPLIAANCAMGIDNTELQRAVKMLEDAQINLRSVRNQYLMRLEQQVQQVDLVEARVAYLKVEIIRLENEIKEADRNVRFHQLKVVEAKDDQKRHEFTILLQRAIKMLEDAQINLRSVRNDHLLRLERQVHTVSFGEDLT